MLRDLRHGARALMRDKGWTAVVVLSLALGIGANTALFSAINGLFLKKLPVKDPDSLVRLRWSGRNNMVTAISAYGFPGKNATGQSLSSSFSYPMFRQFVAAHRAMVDLFACAPYGQVNVVVDGHADIASAFISSGNYYRVLGLTANPGRTIVPEDDQPTAAAVAVISARYWRSRFGSDPRAVGKVVRFNNVPVTIVGVISPELRDVQRAGSEGSDIAVPLALDSQLGHNAPPSNTPNPPRLEQPTNWWLEVMGRVKPGVTAAQVQANLEGVFQHAARAGVDTELPHLQADSGSRGLYDANPSDSASVTILTVVVVLVLLIVCANVANLLLSRAMTRQKELSVRLSLGATRARLVRQLLTESLLLASMGGAAGVLVGYWGQQLLPGTAGQPAPLDWRVLSFVLAITGLTGIVFGIAPALRATGMNVSATLKETNQSVARSSILSKSLLVLQVAISLVLLIAAGLFLRTLQNLRNVDVGFNTRNLVLFGVSPSLNRYDDARTIALYEEMIDRLRAVAGVRWVALSDVPLLSGAFNSTSFFLSGHTDRPDQPEMFHQLVISPGFFETMGMPIRLGRDFTDRDNQAATKVAIINETAARKYFPNENPIGSSSIGGLEIVGVLRDAKYDSIRNPVPPTIYVPFLQTRLPTAIFEVRTAGDPIGAIGAIRETVRKIDPNLPLMNVSTQLEEVDKRLLPERVFAQAYALFGALALLLASIGLFGLMSYSVARRTHEIGIRMALGAQRQDVVRLVMSESMTLVIVGVGIGLAAALAASRLVASLLFGVAATDLMTICAALTVMIIVSATAGYLPARRAARVDPLVALHYD